MKYLAVQINIVIYEFSIMASTCQPTFGQRCGPIIFLFWDESWNPYPVVGNKNGFFGNSNDLLIETLVKETFYYKALVNVLDP